MAISPDGKLLAASSTGDGPLAPPGEERAERPETLFLYDITTGNTLHRFETHGASLYHLAFSPDGRTLTTLGGDPYLRAWDVATGELLSPALDPESSRAAVLSPNGKWLLCADRSETVHLWDLATGEKIRRFKGALAWASSAAIDPAGRTVAVANDRSVSLWNVATGRQLHELPGHHGAVTSVAFAPDGKAVISGSEDHSIRLWNLSGEETARLEGNEATVFSLAHSPDGRQVVSGGRDETVRVWDLASSEELLRLAECDGWVGSVAWSSDGRTVASASHGMTISLWDAVTGRELHQFKGYPWAVAFSPDGRTLAAAMTLLENGPKGDNQWFIQLWDVTSGQEAGALVAPECFRLSCLAFSPDGRFIASGGWREALYLWNLATRKPRRVLEADPDGVTALAFSPDGQALAGEAGAAVRLWEVASGREIRRFEGHNGQITSLAFAPDGRLLASASQDTSIMLWDLSLGQFDKGGQAQRPITAEKLPGLWKDLRADDPGRADRAVWSLCAAPQLAVPFLREHLRAVQSPPPARIAGLIADLGSERFAVRESATNALALLGETVRPAMETAVKFQPSPEVRRRLD